MADLATSRSGSGLQKRVEVDVLTKADPMPSVLRQARVAVQNSQALQAVFVQAKSEGWDSARLTAALVEAFVPFFLGDHPEVAQAAAFLADEYLQLGDHILLISSETGRPIARITDEDIYQPALVPRESGNMVQPAPRLRPELEGFVVQWTFDRAHEEKVRHELAATLPQTPLLRVEGDRRLAFTTRRGRQSIADEVRNRLPNLLPTYCGGAPRSFFNYLRIGSPPSDGSYTSLGTHQNFGNASFPLVDGKAKNLRHDILSASLATTASGWVRGVALHVLLMAKDIPAVEMTVPEVREATKTVGLWVASANASIAIQRLHQGADVLPVGTSDNLILGLTEPFGFLEIDPNGFESRSREVFSRWEVVSSFQSTLWVDWSKVRAIMVNAVPLTGHSVEVL